MLIRTREKSLLKVGKLYRGRINQSLKALNMFTCSLLIILCIPIPTFIPITE